MSVLLHRLESLTVVTFLVSSMGAMGLTLTLGPVIEQLRKVRTVGLALALNFIVAPALAWLLTRLLPLEPGHAMGLLLLGGAAGAPFLPKLVVTARGDLALAAASIGLLTVGTLIFLPFVLPLMIPSLAADPWQIAAPLLLLIVLPVVAGMVVKRWADPLANRLAPVLAGIGNAALLVLFVLLIALNLTALRGLAGSLAVLTAFVYFAALALIAWVLGGLDRESRIVLTLATTARNFGAALVPATSSMSDPNVRVMIIVGAIVCLIVSFGVARWLRASGGGTV